MSTQYVDVIWCYWAHSFLIDYELFGFTTSRQSSKFLLCASQAIKFQWLKISGRLSTSSTHLTSLITKWENWTASLCSEDWKPCWWTATGFGEFRDPTSDSSNQMLIKQVQIFLFSLQVKSGANTHLLCLILFQCVSSRIGENLEQSLPSLKELILTSNNIQELVSVVGVNL